MVAPTCFGITLPSTGRVPSAFWEMFNWRAVDRILRMGVSCLMTWCMAISDQQINKCTELYHSFIQYTGSYMFRQWSAIIRELLGFVWVTWNADRIGGISYNVRIVVCLCGLCAGVLWLRLLCFPAQLGSTTDEQTNNISLPIAYYQ